MGFVISNLTTMMTQDMKSNCEYQLQLISNMLIDLARQSQQVVETQSAMGQAYMEAHKDEEGQIDASAIEWVNSSAFNAKYQAQLRAIQAKEQTLEVQKTQLETKQKMYSNQEESWEKSIDKNVSTFKYGN